jgi:hypothetical protein
MFRYSKNLKNLEKMFEKLDDCIIIKQNMLARVIMTVDLGKKDYGITLNDGVDELNLIVNKQLISNNQLQMNSVIFCSEFESRNLHDIMSENAIK